MKWQGKKDSNLRMSESKSDALTNLATPLRRAQGPCPEPTSKPKGSTHKKLHANPAVRLFANRTMHDCICKQPLNQGLTTRKADAAQDCDKPGIPTLTETPTKIQTVNLACRALKTPHCQNPSCNCCQSAGSVHSHQPALTDKQLAQRPAGR
jgi:hypothetical protein